MYSNNIYNMSNLKSIKYAYFSIDTLHNILTKDTIEDAKKYLHKFVFKVSGGYLLCHYMDEIQKIAFRFLKKVDLKDFFPSDLENECEKVCKVKNIAHFNVLRYLQSTEFCKKRFLTTVNLQTTKRILKEKVNVGDGQVIKMKSINLAGCLGIDTKKMDKIELKKFKKEIKLINDHILNVWCSGNESMNEYCLNFLAHSVAGHKVRTCLYLQSKERSGKGVILNLFKSMLRDRMCKTSSAETVVKYTKPFEGCCLVNLDEVPVQGSYKDYQDKLKSLITEPKFQSRAMYQMGIERPNTFNIILTTNNDAVSLTTITMNDMLCQMCLIIVLEIMIISIN